MLAAVLPVLFSVSVAGASPRPVEALNVSMYAGRWHRLRKRFRAVDDGSRRPVRDCDYRLSSERRRPPLKMLCVCLG